jgi:hypothetical protein
MKHAAPLQDAGVTARRQLEFTTWRAVGRLTQVRRGRGAKRGELRGAAWAGQGRASGAGGVGGARLATADANPPLRSSRSVVWEPAHGR